MPRPRLSSSTVRSLRCILSSTYFTAFSTSCSSSEVIFISLGDGSMRVRRMPRCLSAVRRFIFMASTALLNGLVIYSSAPRVSPSITESTSCLAVSITNGMSTVAGLAFMWRHSCIPSIFGIIRSLTITSKDSFSVAASASTPSAAQLTSKSFSNSSLRKRVRSLLSSTNSILGRQLSVDSASGSADSGLSAASSRCGAVCSPGSFL